jgi:hypothetical protein
MVCEDGVAHRNVASDSLVEPAVGKDTEGGSQMLFAIDALFVESCEVGVCPDLQLLTRGCPAQRARLLVL